MTRSPPALFEIKRCIFFPMQNWQYLEKLRSLARGCGNTATGGEDMSLLCCPVKDAFKHCVVKK
jgi:hypothetical protein